MNVCGIVNSKLLMKCVIHYNASSEDIHTLAKDDNSAKLFTEQTLLLVTSKMYILVCKHIFTHLCRQTRHYVCWASIMTC